MVNNLQVFSKTLNAIVNVTNALNRFMCFISEMACVVVWEGGE